MASGYNVVVSTEALKALKKMDRSVSHLIRAYVSNRLNGCIDPRAFGEALTENRTGQWRYRVGDYRLLCEIKDRELVIYMFKIAHRSTVYKS
jgi:mRNA interferase RelE/StbE